MRPLKLQPNVPAENRLAIAFKADYLHKQRLMELAELFGDVAGLQEPLNISATIRACINFTYGRRKTIMMRRLRAQQEIESEVQPCQTTGPINPSSQSVPQNQEPQSPPSTTGISEPPQSARQSAATLTTP